MKISRNKRTLILTTLLSLFGVAVAAVSTFAWFQVNEVEVPDVENSSLIKSDSTNLEIKNVTGYKYKYNESSYGVTDYTRGEAVSYDSSDTENVDQADRKELDYPANGEGYYIVGNDNWVLDYNVATGESKTSATVWTYESGLRLDDDVVDGNNNIATYNNIFLRAGTEFRFRHHSLTSYDAGQTSTESYNSSWATISGLADNDGKTATAAEMDGSNVRIKTGQSGYYNIYYTNSYQLALYPLELRPSPRSRIAIGGPKKALSAGNKVYFDINGNSNWQDGNAVFDIRFQNTTTWAEYWVSMTQMQSSGIYYATVPTGTWTRLTLTRKSAHSSAWDDNIWNNDDDRDLTNFNNTTLNCLKSTSSSNFKSMSIVPASTQVLAKFTDTFAHADAKNSWAQVALSTSKSCSLDGGATTVTFTSSTSIKLYEHAEFKIINTKSDIWMGYNFLTPKNATYFGQGTRADFHEKEDYNVKIVKNCKCTFAITYYFSDSGWSFSITPTDFSPSFYSLNLYKKNYSTGVLTLVDTLEHEADDITDLYYPGDPSGLTGYDASKLTGYSTWINAWYSDAECSSAISTDGVSGGSTYDAPVTLHTYYTADNLDVTIIYSFLTTSGTYDSAATTAQAKADIADKCRADQNYTFRTLGTSGSPTATIDGYTFFKYSANKTGTGTNYNPGGIVNVGTESKTYYAVYKPSEYTITETYKFFENNGTTAVSGVSLSDESDTAYGTTAFIPSDPGNTKHNYFKSTTSTYYVFEFAGWYTDQDCTTAYTNRTYSGNDTIYAKMVAKAMSTLYIDTSNVSWTSPYVRVFKDGDGLTHDHNAMTTSSRVFTNNNTVYKLTFPTDYKLIFTQSGSYGANVQSVDVYLTATDKNGASRGTNNYCYLDSSVDGSSHRQFTWEVFYGEGIDNTYYLVGDSTFEGSSGNTPWTFAESNAMSTENLPLSVIAKKENRTLTAGMQFKIWHYSSANGRDGEYAVLNSDPETNAALEIDNQTGNIKVRDGVSGTFNIYVGEGSHNVIVKDVNAGSKLYLRYTLPNNSTTTNTYQMGTSAAGGSSYFASYEQGIQVSTAMAAAGVYVGVVRKLGGKSTGYGTSADTYSFVTTGTAQTFDGVAIPSCLKINKAGYYNFYLTSSGTIKITSLPYLVNGSDVKTDGGDDGYYLIPYDATYGNGTFRNGLKMNVVNGESATTAEGKKNIATYSRYTASAGDKFIIKYFENNVTKYSPAEIATDAVTAACLAYDGGDVYRFKASGVYNIFMYKTSTGRAISVAKDSLSDFSRLNSIPSNATTTEAVLNANTTLILDITFDLTTPVDMKISLDTIISGAGLSQYVKYGLFVESDYSGAAGTSDIQKVYNFFRLNAQYSTLKVMSSNASLTTSNAILQGTGLHAYIVIDYNPAVVASMPSNLANNFYFVMKSTQPSA